MDVVVDGVMKMTQGEEHSENATNKSSEKSKNCETFSSVGKLKDIPSQTTSTNSNSDSVENTETGKKSLKSSEKEEQLAITKDNDKSIEMEAEMLSMSNLSKPNETEGKVGESNGNERVQKKSWSEIVGSGCSSANNNDNGTLQDTKVDQDPTEEKNDGDSSNFFATNDNNCSNGILADQHQSQIQFPTNPKSFSAIVDVDSSGGSFKWNSSPSRETHHERNYAIINPNNDYDKNFPPEHSDIGDSSSSAVVESRQIEIKAVEQGFEAVVDVKDVDEDKEDEENDETSCTESFKQLNPFEFINSAHAEKGKRERLYKVLVVGELGSGKTSIIKRYVHQFFSQHYRATIGVDFALKVLRWDGDTVVRLQLWDIAGQERFGSMTRVYYKEAVGAFVVFDVTRSATLEAVPKWKADLDSKVALPDGRTIPTVLLANKSDQPKEGIAANREKMNEFCQQQGFSAWFETSAKDNINIDEASNFLVSKILEMDRWSQEPLSQDSDKVDLNANGKHKHNSSSNCSC